MRVGAFCLSVLIRTQLGMLHCAAAGGHRACVALLVAAAGKASLDGQTATDWTLNWARGLIDGAPRPAHN